MSKAIQTSIRETSGKGGCLPKSLRSKEKAITQMMLIIFSIFLITYIPSFVIKWFDDEYEKPTAHIICYIIYWLSVIMNPLIYVFTQERYRKAYLHLWCRIKNCNNETEYKKQVIARPSFHRQSSRQQRSIDEPVPLSPLSSPTTPNTSSLFKFPSQGHH